MPPKFPKGGLLDGAREILINLNTNFNASFGGWGL